MYALLTGRFPFYWANEKEIGSVVLTYDVPFPQKVTMLMSANCLNLLKRLLTKDPAVRITAFDALRHDWFRQYETAVK
jgi:calcium-dependent protein kinase